ncbi:MAG: ATP-binding cassette domain-containing protein, partial [Planctomycetota bacterium]
MLELEVEGFRSLRHVTWKPDRLNVVIGPNGSGKSNLLRVLEMLTTAGRGGLGKYIQREGGISPLLWDGHVNRLRFRTKMSPVEQHRDEVRDSLTYDIVLNQVGKSSSYRINSELLANFYKVETNERPEPFKLFEREPLRAVIFDSEEKALVTIEEKLDEEETLLSAAAGPVSTNPYVDEFQQRFANWRVYEDIHTDRASEMRQATVARNETIVESGGQNLIAVLHTLYSSNRDFKNEVNTAIRSAFSDDFEELIFPPAADQRIQLRVRWRSLQREQSVADL